MTGVASRSSMATWAVQNTITMSGAIRNMPALVRQVAPAFKVAMLLAPRGS